MTKPSKIARTIASLSATVAWSCAMAYAQTQPVSIEIANAPIRIRILVQSPADTDTDLQAICLFKSSAENKLHGSLVEANGKLKGLLDRVRTPDLFRGDLGETLLVTPPKGALGARKLLIAGLGDSQTFSPQRMQLVGEIVYTEAARLGVAHPFFAPTVIDGGVSKFGASQVAEQAITGFLRAARIDKVLKGANAPAGQSVTALTFLAGPQHASDAREGDEKALAAAGDIFGRPAY